MADTVAELMVKIGGDASELKNAVNDAKGAVSSLGSGLSSVGKGLTIGVTAPILAIGAAAMKASSDVGGAYRSIQRETGATGTELAGLKTAFKDVFSTVPASADEVATALSRITQTMDLSTKATGALATQFLNLSRMTGTDITTNIDSATEAFNAWGEAIPDAGFALDAFYTISQNTGQSVSDISSTLALAAGPAQAAGLGYLQTAIMVAQLGQAGVPTKQIISSLTAVVKDATTNNVSAATEWQNLINKFKDPSYKATADDMAILGNNTTKFANAARNGDLDYGPLLQKIKDSPDAINAMAAGTRSLGENLQIIQNRMTLALAPLGSAMGKAANDSVKALDPLFVGIENLGKGFEKLPPAIQQSVVLAGALASALGPALVGVGNAMPVFDKIWGSLSRAVGSIGLFGAGAASAAVATGEVEAGVVGAEAATSELAFAGGAMIPLWALVAAGVATVAVTLGTAYATSDRFRSLLGELGGIAAQFGARLGTAFEKLTSGDIGGALNEVKVGLQEAFNSLKNIDWGSALATIRDQMLTGIKGGIDAGVSYLRGVDWGGAFDTLIAGIKSIDWGGAWNTLVTSISDAYNSIVSWFQSQDWHSIGEQAGTFIGQALVSAFQLAVDLASWVADALAGLINVGGGEAAGTSLGTQASTGFGAAFSGVSAKIQEQLSRIHIDWNTILGDVGGIFADIGAIAGTGMAIALIGAIQPLLSALHIEIKTDGLMDKAMGNLKGDLGKLSGDLKTSVAVTPDLANFNTQITAATATHHEALITAKAVTEVANSDLSAFAKQSRIADIIAAAKTDIAASSLDTVTKAQRIAEINAIANTVDANGNLNAIAVQRLAEILAQANPGDAAAILNALSAPATKVITVVLTGQTVIGQQASGETRIGAAGMVVGMQSGGHVTSGPQMALIGEAGPEAVIPQKYWGGIAPWVLNSLPKYAGGVTTGGGGGGSGDNTWDKSLKQTADYAVNLKPINDTAARALNYAIVTTQNAALTNQNTGVANQHLNNITAVGQATTTACNTTADACAATAAACATNCTTATDGNTAAIAGSCSSMASSCAATAGSCAATAGSCAATAGSCAATAGSCGTTAGCLTSNCASYASGGYVDKPQFAFIGEKEREYIIPESKMGGVGGRQVDRKQSSGGNVYQIHVEGIKMEDVVEDLMRKLRIRDMMSGR